MTTTQIFGAVPPDTLSDKVAVFIQQAIYDGKLKPGQRVLELGLAKEMGVAQSTVREALQQLEHLGLVVKVPNRGSFVVNLSAEESLQIYAVRSELERLAISLALKQSGEKDLGDVRRLLSAMEEASDVKDWERFVTADFEFHRAIWKLSANPFLEKVLLGLATQQFAYYRIKANRGDTNWEMDALLKKHREIVDVLEGRSEKDARTIIDELRVVVLRGVKDKVTAEGSNEE